MAVMKCNPFAPGEVYDKMWPCCAGTHARGRGFQNNGNDYYAPQGTLVVATIDGTVVAAGHPPIGQGERVGIEGNGVSTYSAHLTGLLVREGDHVEFGQPIGRVWDFSGLGGGIPDHLHYSQAQGSYYRGTFDDPWDEIDAFAVHLNGRTFRAIGGPPGDRPAPPAKDKSPFYLEELPMDMGGLGPRVHGPWDESLEAGVDQLVEQMKGNGRRVAKMHAKRAGLYYIYEYPKGRHGKAFRWGGWATAAQRKGAKEKLTGDGRLQNPREFKGRGNSLYPWLG